MEAQGTDSPDRRPIAARRLRVFVSASEWLAARRVSADGISLAGMACGLAGGLSLALTARLHGWGAVACFLMGAGLVQLRLLANLLDGMVAIASGTASAVGELYNEVPDRISDAAILTGLGLSRGGNAAMGLLAALMAVLVAYIRAAARVAGAPQDFGGPFAKQQRMVVVTVTAIACALLPVAWTTGWWRAVSGETRPGLFFPGPGSGLPAAALALVAAGSALTAALRLRRAGQRLRRPAP